MLNALAVRLADRYVSTSSPLSINRTGRLSRFVVLSGFLACTATIIVFALGSLPAQRHFVHDVDVAFELTCAPPEPSFRTAEELIPLRFEEGQQPAALANKESEKSKTGTETIPEPANAPEVTTQKASRSVPEEAPIAVSRPVISSAPAPQPMAILPPNPFTGNAANAATTNASAPAGGEADGAANATGTGGSGNGAGQGDPNALAGGDFGAQNLISMRAAPVAMGNIGPYKRALVSQLRQIWHPDENYSSVTVEIALDHEGKVLDKSIVVSSGSDRVDAGLLSAIGGAQFAALPEWYRGHELHIRIVLHNS